jgi:ABC-2 type transport system permease protein
MDKTKDAIVVMPVNQWVQIKTIIYYECVRVFRIWLQTLLPPVITSALYFTLFGSLIGARVGQMAGVSYLQFITPGLILMHMMLQSYSNVSASFFTEKFQGSSENLAIAPLAPWVVVLGYMVGGMVRGLCVGVFVWAISLYYTHLPWSHLGALVVTSLVTVALFALMGMINSLFARSFDDIMLIPAFILSPLIYLGGVFYDLGLLSPFWKTVSLFNPVVYLVDAFRYSALGTHYFSIELTVIALMSILLGLFVLACWMLPRNSSIRY